LTSLAAGCSSDAMRFDHGITNSVPAPINGRTQTPQPHAQPYPGDMSAQQGTFDRTYTGSVPAQRTVRLAPPTNVQPVYQRPTTVGLAQQAPNYQQAPSYRQAPVYQPAPVYQAPQQTAVERQPLRREPAAPAPAPQIELAPVPVATAVAPQPSATAGQPGKITRTIEVPVARIPTPSPARRGAPAVRTVQAPAQTYPQTAAVREPAPDPMITGTTPTSAAARAAKQPGDGWTTAGGTRVTIGNGETIYNLSRRYGVPANEILKANNISDASRIRSGQVVIIPTYVYSRKAPVSAPDNDPKTRAARASTGYQGEARPGNIPLPKPAPRRELAVMPSAPAARQSDAERKPVKVAAAPVAPVAKSPTGNTAPTAAAGSSYTVKAGDSLSRIASRTGVPVNALKRANGLTNSTIRVGQTLTIPSSSSAGLDKVQTASVPAKTARPKPAAVKVQAASVAEQSKVEATAPKATGIGKLRWPAKGQVMSKFGSVDGGNRNDGIDISLPNGTPVKAAENGVVIYAGSGLKEYGNTVLVRHDNGLVSVYGHASELVVKRGDTVSRGQVVVLSGMSGQATRPKLHFEIRKDAKPVDPLTYLE